MKSIIALVALAIALCRATAQVPSPPSEARQFDFWLGEWEVMAPDGKKVGDSRIEKVAGGWGLLENWAGTGGYEGKSLNTWLPQKKQWQQFWVGAGDALELIGGLNGRGEMVLAGRAAKPGGKETVERITWTPNPDGTVRQHWESSVDNGVSWTTSFDGLYRPKLR